MGIEIVKRKNCYALLNFQKREIIDKVLLEGRSQRSVSLDCSPQPRNSKLAGTIQEKWVYYC